MAKQNSRFEQAKREATEKVNALQNLSDKQREHVRVIAFGHIESHAGEQIHYANVANHVRSMKEHLADDVLATSQKN